MLAQISFVASSNPWLAEAAPSKVTVGANCRIRAHEAKSRNLSTLKTSSNAIRAPNSAGNEKSAAPRAHKSDDRPFSDKRR